MSTNEDSQQIDQFLRATLNRRREEQAEQTRAVVADHQTAIDAETQRRQDWRNPDDALRAMFAERRVPQAGDRDQMAYWTHDGSGDRANHFREQP